MITTIVSVVATIIGTAVTLGVFMVRQERRMVARDERMERRLLDKYEEIGLRMGEMERRLLEKHEALARQISRIEGRMDPYVPPQQQTQTVAQ